MILKVQSDEGREGWEMNRQEIDRISIVWLRNAASDVFSAIPDASDTTAITAGASNTCNATVDASNASNVASGDAVSAGV